MTKVSWCIVLSRGAEGAVGFGTTAGSRSGAAGAEEHSIHDGGRGCGAAHTGRCRSVLAVGPHCCGRRHHQRGLRRQGATCENVCTTVHNPSVSCLQTLSQTKMHAHLMSAIVSVSTCDSIVGDKLLNHHTKVVSTIKKRVGFLL